MDFPASGDRLSVAHNHQIGSLPGYVLPTVRLPPLLELEKSINYRLHLG